jgi:GxxExxY protein
MSNEYAHEYRGPSRGPGRPPHRGGERRGVPLSALDPTTTEASRKVIGAAIEVHRALGPGFSRDVYSAALRGELDAQGVKHEVGKVLPVKYKDRQVGSVTCDLYVENLFIVSVTANPGPVGTPERLALRAQLKAANFELGLIINFGERRLKDGLVRVVNIDKLRAEKGIGADDDLDEGGSTHEFDH